MSKRPLDVEVTPNGLVAVVRGHAPGFDAIDGLTFVDTTTGVKLNKSGCGTAGQGGYFYTSNDFQPSDSLRVTNSRAILVGARDTDNNGSHDRTYIDVLAIDMSGPTVTCLAHHEQGSTTSPNLQAGWTNDVEITPDESFAIVNSSNWIHVINLSNGTIAQAFNIGSFPTGPCFAGDSVDSIATTNDTAVVTTTRIGFVNPPWYFTRTWVYLIDLVGSSTPTIQLEHELTGPLPTEEKDFWPHDVAITPNGSLAIVTANNAVALYDLSQHAFLARDRVVLPSGHYYRRRYFSDIVDSIEPTDSWFVTIATDEVYLLQGQTQILTSFWTIDAYSIPPQISPSNPEDMYPKRSWRMRDYMNTTVIPPTYQGIPMTVDSPHDLAIDEQEAVAVIRSGAFNLVLTGLDEPDAQNMGLVMDFDLGGIANNYAPANTFVSDSVLIAPGFVKHLPEGQPGQGVFHYALTLGSEWKTVGTPPFQYQAPWAARVHVIDLKLTPPAVVHTFRVEDSSTFPHIYPADFHLGPGPREFVLRCNALPNDSGVIGGRDFVRYSLDPLSELRRIGGQGRVWAVDSMEVGRFNATSVGETPASSTGFVHVVHVQ